jgi:predicted N-formylglutamate amidohydrolase
MDSFKRLRPESGSALVLVCDHASNLLPEGYGTLGLPPEAFGRHIAYDIGAAALTAALSERLGAEAILAGFSRLLIDPNRGAEDPTLIMALSDGALIPANHPLAPAERARRLTLYYEPYHAAITQALDLKLARGLMPRLISIHSFTPVWRGQPRPWQVGVLWNRDGRLARLLLEALRAEGDLVVGDNEPYSGELEGDCMDRHGSQRGLPHVLIEIRQDLIETDAGVAAWAERVARVLKTVV